MKWIAFTVVGLLGCSSGPGEQQDAAGSDAPLGNDVTPSEGGGSDGGPSDAGTNPIGLSCAATKGGFTPSACPAPSGAAGHVSFCFRSQWAGVTSVDVYGGFTGTASDWKSAFVTLTNDGTGTFTGTTTLANGSYPYLFHVTGADDNLVRNGTFLLDQQATEFMPAPTGAPLLRSVPVVTVPQGAPPTLHHLRGKVVYNGEPQPCFSVSFDVGELYKDGGGVLSEQSTANYAESAADGTFDFPIASGPVMAVVRYPFLLTGVDAGYPDPSQTPAIGYARTGTNLAAGDVTLDPVEVSYPSTDYAKMAPTNGTASLPVTFTYSVIPESASASVAVIGTNIAGNDPAYWSAFGTTTSLLWDGGLNGQQGSVVLGTKYWWGTWQKRMLSDAGTSWSEESLLYPITFQ